MSNMITANIERAYVDMFKEGFQHVFQQKMSKLRPLVEVESQGSEFEFYDRIGLADDMNEVTSRYEDSPLNEVPHERRRIGLRDFDWGKLIDDKDLIRVASDPSNAYTQAGLAAANRLIDDLIIEGFTAPAYIGKKGETTVNFVGTTVGDITVGAISNENGQVLADDHTTITAGNVEGIDVNESFRTGTTTTNITTDKLISIRETLLTLEAANETDMFPMLVSPNQQSALLRESGNRVTSVDFNTERTLVNGFVDTWLGFKFIYTNRLPKTGDIRSCFVLGPKGMKLGISKDLNVDIYRRPDKKNIPYILIKMGMGVSRMWGEHVVRVRCDETK